MSETQSQPVPRLLSIPRLLIRITFLLQIVLGLTFWAGKAKGLTPLHVVSGIILVVSILVLAYAAAKAGVSRGLISLTAIWALILFGLGASQENILKGDQHWIIRTLH